MDSMCHVLTTRWSGAEPGPGTFEDEAQDEAQSVALASTVMLQGRGGWSGHRRSGHRDDRPLTLHDLRATGWASMGG